jgi:hypothetical protein
VHLLHVTPYPSHWPSPLAIVQLCSLWLSSDFQAEEELLGQARIFKVFVVTGMSFHHP